MRKIVAVIGDAFVEENSLKYTQAKELGKLLVDNGYRIQTGGLNGVMKAVFEGAKTSTNYVAGDTIGIVPSFNRD